MNKQLINLIIPALLLLGGCSKDFLTLTPPTNLTDASFYKNKDQLIQAVNGAYEPLRGIVRAGFYLDEMRSDNTFFTRYAANRGFETSTESIPLFLDDENSSATPNSPGNLYGLNYVGISAINTIMSKMEGLDLSDGARDTITGEALFLRAFYYFNLVQHFGGMPLQLDVIIVPTDAFKPRNTVEQVYDQVIADLLIAIPKLPVATSFPQSGRATRGAAKMLLAYAYMSKPAREYDKAEAELRDILAMNYQLLPDYASVFDPENKNNAESIFEVQYLADQTSGQQSDFAWRFAPKTTNPLFLLGFQGGSMDIFSGWNVPTQEMVDSYEDGDERLPASVAVVEGTISGVEDFTATAVKSPVGYTPAPSQTFFYMIKKYYHPPYDQSFNTPDNFPIFRYSGALLLLAECLVERGMPGDALKYLNQVRDRAGLDDLGVATKQNVADEMRHELAFENHRWTDLIRIGQAIPVLTAKGNTLKAIYPWILPNAFNVTTEKLVYPIPFREIQINNELVQNPGY